MTTTEKSEETDEGNKLKTYDDVFDHVRSFGKYQWFLYIALRLMVIPINGQINALVFSLGTPKFQCTTPNVTCPPRKCCENCTSYEFSGEFSTTVTEWNLICDKMYVGASLQMAYFAGMLVGSLVTGIISDAFGRKTCIFSAYAIMLVAGVVSCFVDCVSFFGLLRFIVGFGLTGAMLSNYVYSMEMVGPKRRTTAAAVAGGFWGFGALLCLLEAYFIREWRYLLLVFTVPAVLFFPFLWIIPESARWLVLNGRLDEALTVLHKYGGKKGKPIDTEALRHLLGQIREDQLKKEMDSKKYTVIDLVRTKKLRKWSIVMAYQWFTVAFVNFATFLFLSQLSGNIYLNYAIMRSIAAMSVPFDWLLLVKFGRRGVHSGYAIIGAISLLIILGVYKDYPQVTTGLTIFAINIGPNWNTVYLMTVELYPTSLRNTAVGSGSMCARVGAILAPYFAMIAQLPGLSLEFPVTVFGVVALVAGLMTFLLPETVFSKMHQTVEEVESAEDDYVFICCGKHLRRRKKGATEIVMAPEVEETENTAMLTTFSAS